MNAEATKPGTVIVSQDGDAWCTWYNNLVPFGTLLPSTALTLFRKTMN